MLAGLQVSAFGRNRSQNSRSFSLATKGRARDLLLSDPTKCQCRAMATKNRVTTPDLHYQRWVLIRHLQHGSIIQGRMVNLLGAAQHFTGKSSCIQKHYKNDCGRRVANNGISWEKKVHQWLQQRQPAMKAFPTCRVMIILPRRQVISFLAMLFPLHYWIMVC